MRRQRLSFLPGWLALAAALCYLSIAAYPWLLIFGVLAFHPLHLLAIVVWAFVPSWINAAHQGEA